MIPANFWLTLALLAGAAGVSSLVVFFAPNRLVDERLRGYRATRRDDALRSSGLLRMIWPIVRFFTHYAALLPAKEWKEKKSLLLRHAGEPLGLSVDEFLGLSFTSTICSFLIGFLFTSATEMGFGLVIVGTALGIALPTIWLNEKAGVRLLSINRGLPGALDLIVLSMGAGLDFIGAVRQVVDKWSDTKDPLCEELSRFLHELTLGKSRRDALSDLEYRAPTAIVKTFVTNAIQAEKRGTPLIEVLRIQAEVARTTRFQNAERIAGRAGVVILLPLMFILFAAVLVMFGGLIVKGFRGELF